MAAGSNPQAATCTLLAEGAGATEKVGKLFRSRITAITSARASPDQVNVNSQQSIFAHFHDNASASAATQRHADGRSSRWPCLAGRSRKTWIQHTHIQELHQFRKMWERQSPWEFARFPSSGVRACGRVQFQPASLLPMWEAFYSTTEMKWNTQFDNTVFS